MTERFSKEEIKQEIEKKLVRRFGVTVDEANKEEMYQAVGFTVRDMIMEKWTASSKDVGTQNKKRLYYLSAEFLMGRALVNNMINLEMYDTYKEALTDFGYNIEDIEGEEKDAGLGNGGLGRLAACFLDSISTLEMPVTGCCIRYEHGLFKQRIVNGEQTEVEDDWLEDGNIWEIARPDDKVEIKFGGKIEEEWGVNGLSINQTGYTSVLAYPYDYPVIGYDSDTPATLRLWSARAKTEIDMEFFNRGDYVKSVEEKALVESVSQVLYPEDNHEEGRKLRLRQFYFLTSASMQFLVNGHKRAHDSIHTLPDFYTIQINDTHPTFAIPELIRILMDDEGLSWEEAFGIASKMFNYTNHTIMAEALERWNEAMLKELLPRIHRIIQEIDHKFREKIWEKWPGDWSKMNDLAIISGGEIRMANLCIAVCNKVNGVSQLHADIIKTNTFRDFYTLFPDKFLGITNGITTRRWLAKANRDLTHEIESRIGSSFLKKFEDFDKIKAYADDVDFQNAVMDCKRKNKERLRDYLFEKQGIEINVDSIFDVQAKRLHEYKRQLLKLMHILHLYFKIKSGEGASVTPATFIFAAKAAPGYYRAKEIIRLILAVGEMINNDPDAKDIIKIVFIENYSVSEAEMLIPAADVSEQLSTAGLEASGTGNMKFMLNGAVTIGTMDGANVEIFQAVGPENIFIFGASVEEIERIKKYSEYNPHKIYDEKPEIKRILECMINGSLPVQSGKQFNEIYDSLLFGNHEPADKYFLLYDFQSYDEAYQKLAQTYENKDLWKKLSAVNIVSSGIFSSDRTITEYNNNVWHLEACK